MSFVMKSVVPTFRNFIALNEEKLGLSRDGYEFISADGKIKIIPANPMTVIVEAPQPDPEIGWLEELVRAYEVVQKQWDDTTPVIIEVQYAPEMKKEKK